MRPYLARRATPIAPVIIALILAVSVLAPAGAGASPPPRDFFGTQDWFRLTDSDLRRLSNANVRVYRMDLLWARVEPTKPRGDCRQSCTHSYDWRSYDSIFRSAARRGIRILPVLVGSPSWSGAWKPQVQPTTPSGKRAFQHFARAAARRYGPEGTLWSELPWSPSRPARSAVRAAYWQVWNEPNIATSSGRGNWWWPRPSPHGYAKFLKGASVALKRASPRVQVVVAGLPYPQYGYRADTYLYHLLSVPGVNAAIDVAAVHPYAPHVSVYWQEDVMDRIASVRRTMDTRGARTKRLWVTEIGWATGTPDGRLVTERQQKANLDELYRRLLALRTSYRLIGAIWFSLKDFRPTSERTSYWSRTGLFRRDGSAKPSWITFRARALNGY